MKILLFPILAVSLGACGVDQVDPEIIIPDDEPAHPEKLSANALSPADLAATGITAAKFTQTIVNTVSATREGRASLVYLINCAMPVGYSIVGQYNCMLGSCSSITYTGGLNLASTWTSSNLTQTQQRQVSGCVFARLNELSRSVTISLRGAPYAMDPNEAASYVYPEGVFFGNLFPGTDNHWGACDSAGPTHQDRQCAQEGHCSMSWAGDCATACTLDVNANATSCVGTNGTTYAQPTTVFLNAVTL